MAEYTFKQFQEEYPNDAAWIMEIQWGGDVPTAKSVDKRTKFLPMAERWARGIYPCNGRTLPRFDRAVCGYFTLGGSHFRGWSARTPQWVKRYSTQSNVGRSARAVQTCFHTRT